MTHDVFVSHSHRDKTVADAIVARLEADGVRCWIAPRDIVPGMNWGQAIVEAIGGSKVMVLVLSEHSNSSSQVLREVERAVHANVSILPFRVDEVDPSGALSYFLGTEHWLDAMTPPLEQHLARLSETVSFLIDQANTPVSARADGSRRPGHVPIPRATDRRRPLWPIVSVAGLVVGAIVALMWITSRDGADTASMPTQPVTTPRATAEVNPVPATTAVDEPSTSTTTSTTTLPPLGLEEVARFQPFDLDLTDQHVPDPITGIDIADNVLAFANGIDGVTLVSIGTPDTPMAMATYSVANAHAVEISDDLIYAIGGGTGGWRFEIFDTDGLGAVEIPLSGTDFTDFDDLEVADGYAYASGWNYVGIIDATDPSAPDVVFDWTPEGSTGNPAHVVIDGTTGYFGAGWDGLYVFDLTDPSTPVLTDHWISPDWVIDVAIEGTYAYVTLGDTGLAVLDASDPSNLRTLGTVELPGFASMIDVADGHAFVGWFGSGSSPGGIAAIDATDPTTPIVAGTFGTFTALTDLQVDAGHVFVSDEADDLVVFRITDEGTSDGS